MAEYRHLKKHHSHGKNAKWQSTAIKLAESRRTQNSSAMIKKNRQLSSHIPNISKGACNNEEVIGFDVGGGIVGGNGGGGDGGGDRQPELCL
ncbi:hypothetical protein [Cloacibacillus evryensis]|uniref:hypothetical protein n=1 Tax=Cloacibacillus evryensis TaxID=508460 RepID=UPI00146FBA43|nr:hypothetical protein [Cloacibacillus evryensis]